ncbi:leucine--tRNA ligase [Nanoarchaeota archaeon]
MVEWHKIEKKWQKKWVDLGKAEVDSKRPKFMMIFAYPGISGFLHVGHMRGFSYTDAICRYKRLNGFNVLYPVGTHSSGNQAIAFANKVKSKDEAWIDYLLKNGCPKGKLKELEDPKKVIKYFNEVYVNDYWKKFGFICDWDRFICTSYPDYEKFMQWQFKKLMENNLLVQKPYFATACIRCGPVAVDASETDISKGGNAEKQEFTLLKFKLGKDFLIAATLRPETIFGQTNLWVNPKVDYVRVEVEGENWIMSKQGAQKLSYQKDDVLLKEDVPAKDLIGKKVMAPGINREIIILPSDLANPSIGSGIVTSVPSDAPYDYVALRELQGNKGKVGKFGLDFEEIKNIDLIPIIISKGFGDFPAREIIEREEITSLKDKDKLDKITKDVYKSGFHNGVMNEKCGKYSGLRVEEAKEMVKTELIEKGNAGLMQDLTEEVTCRCGGSVIIKKIDDQWFIRYSDEILTEKCKKHVNEMDIFPQEYKDNLPGILEWFTDRACVRLGNWTGSKFPFDDKWIIEPISDSTLYPAYYIAVKFKKELCDEFFDYVFLGKGEPKNKNWEIAKAEFDYFYPLDINLGGKEHKTVHFPVFLMNHVGILPKNKWPKGIFVNWWVTGEGSKISKSKGGAVPITNAIKKYGVDAMRLYYAHIGSPHIDVVWTSDIVFNYKSALERIFVLIEELGKGRSKGQKIDDWLMSRVNGHIKKVDSSMSKYDLRELSTIIYYNFYDDLRWYQRRGGRNKKLLGKVIEVWSILMNPVTPHLSEEINSEKGLVSDGLWPVAGEIDLKAEASEELVRKTIEGIRNVLGLAKVEHVERISLFISEKWKYKVFGTIKREIEITRNRGEIIHKILSEEGMKIHGKNVSNLVNSLLNDVSKLPEVLLSQDEEWEIIESARDFLEKEFKGRVEVISGEDSDNPKARSAMPGKVGVLVE